MGKLSEMKRFVMITYFLMSNFVRIPKPLSRIYQYTSIKS